MKIKKEKREKKKNGKKERKNKRKNKRQKEITLRTRPVCHHQNKNKGKNKTSLQAAKKTYLQTATENLQG